MRMSTRHGPLQRVALLSAAVLTLVLAGCGSAPPSSPPPTPRPTPVVTPDPHLSEPATADEVFRALSVAGLKVVANNASSGGKGREPIKRINATYADWPLNVSQFSTGDALRKATKWKKGQAPGQGEAPIAILGLNILIEWGPTTGAKPPKPEGRRLTAANALVDALDAVVGPLTARTSTELAIPVPTPAASDLAAAGTSPAPSAKVTPKP